MAGSVVLVGTYKTLTGFHNSGLPFCSRSFVPFLPPEPSHYPSFPH